MAGQIDNSPGDGGYTHGVGLTLSDTPLVTLPRALMARTTAGIVTVVTQGGDEFVIYLPLGVPVPVRASIVRATGATAAGVTALW